MNKKDDYNPNLDAKELIEPMIFEREDGTPLIEPMVFYDRPLDFSKPLPPVKPLGIEYFINWKKVDEQEGKRVMPLDYLREKGFIVDQPEIPAEPSVALVQNPTKKSGGVATTDIAQAMQEVGDEGKPYSIMRYFISKVNVIIVNNQYYVYVGSSYTPYSKLDLNRLVIRECRHRIKDKSSSFVDGIVDFILKEPDIFVPESEIPNHLVAFQNYILDIKNRRILPPSPEYYTLYSIQANLLNVNEAYTPVFDAFLASVTGGDPNLIERIWQSLGYILTPDMRAKCLFLFQGVKNSGKSVLSNFIQELFPKNAKMPLDVNSLKEKFSLSSLVGKALCTYSDMTATPFSEGAVSVLKQLTGNDSISSDKKYSTERVKFTCTAKIVYATNHA